MQARTTEREIYMAKQQRTMIPSGAKAARAIDPNAEPAASTSKHEQIARLAYSYWQDRRRREGSPEKDWLRAEAELEKQA
jgi:Protein of unknown function (DUF2934)